MSQLIDQRANHAGDFGAVFRSSAIFFKPPEVKTTLSVSNYWSFKNGLDVSVLISVRDIGGSLVRRHLTSFERCNVLNYEVSEIDEGSIEIEAFSSQNLRIPYAAVMVIYETQNSVSMVHSYGRNHSLIELEERRTILAGRESCWSLKTHPDVTSSAVFHNGHIGLERQKARFIVMNASGQERTLEFEIPPIAPFESVIFSAETIFPDLKKFLGSADGWGSLHFESRSSFTRLLILWENSRNHELQVTHSNFDYSTHRTNEINSTKPAYMILPTIHGRTPDAIVYPRSLPGRYSVNDASISSNGLRIEDSPRTLAFRRSDGDLPARIVTAVSGNHGVKDTLNFECSLGVVHEDRPPKRFHWFVVSSKMRSLIHFTSYEEIYPPSSPIKIVFRLYVDSSENVEEVTAVYETLQDIPEEIVVDDIFDLSSVHRFAYVSVFSEYGGFVIFSSLRKRDSITVEHSF